MYVLLIIEGDIEEVKVMVKSMLQILRDAENIKDQQFCKFESIIDFFFLNIFINKLLLKTNLYSNKI